MVTNGACPKTAVIGGFGLLLERNVPPAVNRGAVGPQSAPWHGNPYSGFEARSGVTKWHRGAGDGNDWRDAKTD
jgi:hypothetical protein